MHQIYRILRDNKEKGPFSLEELLQLSLQPFDLIWVEGRSAGWRYPSEIETLKPYLDNPDPGKDSAVAARQSHPASQTGRQTTSPPINAQPLTEPVSVEEKEEELTSEKLEKKAADLYLRVQAYAQQKEQQEGETQVKYARSLDDLKQEYADWLHKKKSKRNPLRNKNLLATISLTVLVLIASLFFVFGRNKRSRKLPVEQSVNYVESVSASKENTTKSTPGIEPKLTSAKNIISSKPQHKELSVDEFIDSVERVMARGNHSKHIPYFNSGKPKQVVQQSAVIAHDSTRETPVSNEQKMPVRSLVNMDARYQQDPGLPTVSSLEVTIHNNSREVLNSVTVDVFYYKRGERLFDKETLYFNNIQPGNSLTVSKPGNKKAVSARFQLGQIN
jgi:hypothetical protein